MQLRIFKSVWRKHIIFVINIPSVLIEIRMLNIFKLEKWIILCIHKSPYLPSFSKTAAKIIDPASGASTWALGSHKWRKNRESFTKNAVIHINQLSDLFIILGKII